MAEDETHLAGSAPTSSSGWLTSTEAIDHGRFPPGTVLDGRYRIVGRLGRGGMGEVYRADDLKLGQPVALKFLPEALDRDPARLTQLHAEVRMARQVSHPNVCRVYDVGEFEGHTFLSMEYVDGEDLASLLRRIGRFPQDRAIELARQICAGLAAAHDRGVVHRDLKPANVMLDGTGRIRITDFGLAGASGEQLRAGTPAYMAPEQLAGQEVTPRSDVYALGLVLYELFTGRRAIEARNLAELIAKREQVEITLPTAIVRDLDPAIERTIMRCLDPQPERRPSSALAVAAGLPGGDPLAAALAAGETPSPEMVAASGHTSALGPLPGLTILGATLVLLALVIGLSDRLLATSLTPMPKAPLLLQERAKDILASLGYPRDTADSADGFISNDAYLAYLGDHRALNTPTVLAAGEPPLLFFWRRGSPVEMVPTGQQSRVTPTDPPMTVAGMSHIVIDPEGRLVALTVVPPQTDEPARGSPVNWHALFDAAGLDMSRFAGTTSTWTPHAFADSRAAWTGPLPGVSGQTLRVEAAAFHGKPVSFIEVAPWNRPESPGSSTSRPAIWQTIATFLVILLFVSAAFVARHNVRKGRGDRRGALRLAIFVSIVAAVVGVIGDTHVHDSNTEMVRFLAGQPLWAAGLLWLLYLAIEPYVRRFWPTRVISWSRLMAGQWRDPLVGREVLTGIAIGSLVVAIQLGSDVVDRLRGHADAPRIPDLTQLPGAHMVFAHVLNQMFNTLLNALLAVFAFVLLKLLVRREWAVAAVAIGVPLFFAGLSAAGTPSPAFTFLVGASIIVLYVLTIQRLGLLATVMLFLVTYTMSDAVLTYRTSAWFFGPSLLIVVVPVALAGWGFYASRGGEPLFGRHLLD